MIVIKIIVQVMLSIFVGLLTYLSLCNGWGKYGVGDTVDKVQSVLMGICAFLLSGIFLY